MAMLFPGEFVLDPGTAIVPGRAYVALGVDLPSDLAGPQYTGNGVVVVAPDDPDIVSIGQWTTALGATHISSCDFWHRLGMYADGRDIFEV